MFILVVNIFGSIVILDDLILYYAHTGLAHRKFGERQTLLVGRAGRRKKNAVDFFLRVSRKFFLCRAYARKRSFQLLHAVHNLIFFVLHLRISLFCIPNQTLSVRCSELRAQNSKNHRRE